MKPSHFFYRGYQVFYRILSYLVYWPEPKIFQGSESQAALAGEVKHRGHKKVLIVTDTTMVKLGLLQPFLTNVKDQGISYAVFDKTQPNPTIAQVEEAALEFLKNQCDSLVGFGGGSSIDCAKAVGARIARPGVPFSKLKGQLRVRKSIPGLFAVPTTSGTGSEATIAAVITDPENHLKYAVNDMVLVPKAAALDPSLTLGLPGPVTAATGMDALTHAVEAFIGRANTRSTEKWSLEAVPLIFRYLPKAYQNGKDLEARSQVQWASYRAGAAFTRAYIGYVHALAHSLGGLYGTPHGLANAVLLPAVLEYYGDSVNERLGILARSAGIGEPWETSKVLTQKFIHAIKEMNRSMGIPGGFKELKEKDISFLASRAHQEANPLYPVPKILGKPDLEKILTSVILGDSE